MLSLLSVVPGGPETLVLSERPMPEPERGQILIRVICCGVNFPDSLIIEDKYQYRPRRPFAPGAEVACYVAAVGDGVDAFSEGDRVMAMPGWGGMAEYVAVDAVNCISIPDAMPFQEAAAFIMTYGTAYHALAQRGVVQPGEILLILGAAGGVGLAAVEVGKALGARVIAATSSETKLKTAIAKGADAGLTYKRGVLGPDARKELASRLKRVCDGRADVVLDPVGGDLTEAAIRALAWNGRLLIVGFPAGIPRIPANLLLLKGASAVGVFYGHFAQNKPASHRANMLELFRLYAAGKLKPEVTQNYPLSAGGRAIAALQLASTHGKIVISVADEPASSKHRKLAVPR